MLGISVTSSGTFQQTYQFQRNTSKIEVACEPFSHNSRHPPTRVPPMFRAVSSKPCPLERENSSPDSVRSRLHKLIADQQLQELEKKFALEQHRLKRLLLHQEIQKVVTKKVKELNALGDLQSINSTVTPMCMTASTAGVLAPHNGLDLSPQSRGGVRRAHTTGTSAIVNCHGHTRYRHPTLNEEMRCSSYSKSLPNMGGETSSFFPLDKVLAMDSTLKLTKGRESSRTPSPTALPTIPSVPFSSLGGDKMNRTHAGDSVYHCKRLHTDNANDDISEVGSQCRLGSLNVIKRHPLIIIRKKDINFKEVQAIIKEKMASPEKWAKDEHYSSSAFPAIMRASTKDFSFREPQEIFFASSTPVSFRSVVSAVSSKNNPRRGFDESDEIENSPLSSSKSFCMSEKDNELGTISSADTVKEKSVESERNISPAPFLKSKSKSSILHTQLDSVEENSEVPVRRVSAASISIKADKKEKNYKGASGNPLRSSQLFALNAPDLNLGELQSEEILESRYRGWAQPVPTLSSKHPSSTNFY